MQRCPDLSRRGTPGAWRRVCLGLALLAAAVDAAVEAPPKACCLKRTSATITCDGQLLEPAYQPPPTLALTFLASGQTAEVRTDVWLFYDDARLYLAVKCQEPCADKIRCRPRERDGSVWEDDDVEFFLQSGEDEYIQVLVSPAGAVADFASRESRLDRAWSGVEQVAACRQQDGWTAELTVTLSAVPVKPDPAHALRGNVVRSRRAVSDQYIGWAMPTSNFHDRSRWGWFTFDAYAPSLTAGLQLETGRITAAGLVADQEPLQTKWADIQARRAGLEALLAAPTDADSYGAKRLAIDDWANAATAVAWDIRFRNLLTRGGAQ